MATEQYTIALPVPPTRSTQWATVFLQLPVSQLALLLPVIEGIRIPRKILTHPRIL